MPGPKFAKPWHGIPREEIDWHPTVDAAACIACGTCVTGCGRLVYRLDYDAKKAVVVGPAQLHGRVRHLRQHVSDARHQLPAARDGLIRTNADATGGGVPKRLPGIGRAAIDAPAIGGTRLRERRLLRPFRASCVYRDESE